MDVPPEPPGRPVHGADPETGFRDDGDAEISAAMADWEPPELATPTFPSRLASWRRTSIVGAVMTGWALGLREVLEPKRDEQIVIEVDADGEPHDLPIRLMLDPDDPSGSLCIVRRDPPPPQV